MYQSNLNGANLSNVDLTDANSFQTDLTGVIWSNTTCPDGVPQSTECAF
jgi:uncharacterized protein YjbI with pentapeptide repeats